MMKSNREIASIKDSKKCLLVIIKPLVKLNYLAAFQYGHYGYKDLE
ncbi:hypothetical protein [Arenibacter sp. S6351L]|nr:hypothetical protein [Arenibacter sp. S6351L]MCK0133709.1 hypothetical protein [Arenibacter sp. S6351L]